MKFSEALKKGFINKLSIPHLVYDNDALSKVSYSRRNKIPLCCVEKDV